MLKFIHQPRDQTNLVGFMQSRQQIATIISSKGRLPNAFLLSGPHQLGKATLAYRIMRALTCYYGQPKAEEVIKAVTWNFKDDQKYMEVSDRIIIMDTVANSTDNSFHYHIPLNTANLRGLGKRTGYMNAKNDYYCVLIDKIDDLNKYGINSILKLIEDPPQNVIFFLIANVISRVPPTIISRCRRLFMRPLISQEMENILQINGLDLSKNALVKKVIDIACGRPGYALQCLRDNFCIEDKVDKIISQNIEIELIGRKAQEISAIIQNSNEPKFAFERFLRLIYSHLRVRMHQQAINSNIYKKNAPEVISLVNKWHQLLRDETLSMPLRLNKIALIISGLKIIHKSNSLYNK